MIPRDILSLLGYCMASLVLLLLGGWLTYIGIGEWYYSLDFPPFQPPSWMFTPAWVVVLTCLAFSTWMVGRKAADNIQIAILAMIFYGAQCVLNGVWSLLFFTMQRPDFALWELLVLDASIIAMVWSYWKITRWAALLLIPYVVWLALSTAINIWIVMHNSFPVLEAGTT